MGKPVETWTFPNSGIQVNCPVFVFIKSFTSFNYDLICSIKFFLYGISYQSLNLGLLHLSSRICKHIYVWFEKLRISDSEVFFSEKTFLLCKLLYGQVRLNQIWTAAHLITLKLKHSFDNVIAICAFLLVKIKTLAWACVVK